MESSHYAATAERSISLTYSATLVLGASVWYAATSCQRTAQTSDRLCRPSAWEVWLTVALRASAACQTALLAVWLRNGAAQLKHTAAHGCTLALLLVFWLLCLGFAQRRHKAALAVLLSFAVVQETVSVFKVAERFQSLPDGSAQHDITLARLILRSIQLAAVLAALLALCAEKARCSLSPEGLYVRLLGGTSNDLEQARRADDKGGQRMQLVCGVLRYLWPDTCGLRLRLVACFVLIGLGRFVNLAVPVLFQHVVDRLSAVSSQTHPEGAASGLSCLGKVTYTFWDVFYPWVFLYLVFYYLQGGSGAGSAGLLNNTRQLLWIPITQSTYQRVSIDVFQHLLNLDMEYHLHRKTGMVMRVLDRGTGSIQDIMAVIIFNVAPQIIDIVAATVYIAIHLQPWVAVIVFVTVASYIPLTIGVTEWRGKVRKAMNALDNDKEARATDMLLNYETVKYFGNEDFELRNYSRAITHYQAAEYLQIACLAVLALLQSTVIFFGLACGLVVCVRGIAAGSLSVGHVVLFLMLMNQLYAPLNVFGSYYRQVQKGLIDMENMFQLLARPPAVQDAPDAAALHITQGALSFEGVTFSYHVGQPVLSDVSFSIQGGQTLALVGATGSGKSSVLRLLLRFYDPQAGCIRLDGQDIRHVTQRSLRAAVAVVPQDAVLFNNTIGYNIRYGRTDASDEDVAHAAKVAHIHEAIEQRFPSGMETLVGERGLRLSGGEKQRAAFARAVLKDTPLMLLDEATSSLDTLTERRIQESLADIRSRRTTVMVAHRLSTIKEADLILVLDGGRVAQAGRHAELIAQGGLYAAMWAHQREHPAVMTLADLPKPRQEADEAATEDGPGSSSGSKGTSRPASSIQQ